MKGLEMINADGYVAPGSCFGFWDQSDPLCSKCIISKECEEKVKRKNSNYQESKYKDKNTSI